MADKMSKWADYDWIVDFVTSARAFSNSFSFAAYSCNCCEIIVKSYMDVLKTAF